MPIPFILIAAKVAHLVYQNYFEEKTPSYTPAPDPVVKVKDRICLVGKTGSGKSSTGNALLGYNHFAVSAANGSTTKVTGADYKDGFKIKDTPGLLDSVNYDNMVISQIRKSKIIVYVSAEAPYGPELDFFENIFSNVIGSKQHFLFYLNNQDQRERMTKKDAEIVYRDTANLLTVSL